MVAAMDKSLLERFRPRSRVAIVALAGLAGYFIFGYLGWGLIRFLFGVVAVAAFAVLGWRLLGYARRLLLWRLRNRLMVTYLFISIIPIGLILLMVGLTSYLLYGQLAAYLIASDLEGMAVRLGAVNRSLASGLGAASAEATDQRSELERWLKQEGRTLADEYGEVQLTLVTGGRSVSVPGDAPAVSCRDIPPWVEEQFHGAILFQGELYLHSIALVPGRRLGHTCLTVPVNEKLLTQVGQAAGQYSLILLEEVLDSSQRSNVRMSLGDRNFTIGQTLKPPPSNLPDPAYFFDPSIRFGSTFSVAAWQVESEERRDVPILLTLTTRASLLNQRIFAPLGEQGVSRIYLVALAIVGVVLLLVQLVSVITGVRLTRSITYAVHELYGVTEKVQAGDFSVRIKTKRDDQLGALCDSFNQMAGSIEDLIEESKARERLENEVEIARQVQEQLFPRETPLLNTLVLAGRCLPAQGVSGDYFDYGLSAPGKLIFTIGDISGKGISAALLMASIQSALRGQVYASQLTGQIDDLGAAELVSRINRQLCATTSPEKYSTLFVAFYDDETRQLTYTNAGHLPPMLLRNGSMEALTTGGAVVGLFSNIQYEQATVSLDPGDYLVAYTDGVTEIENSYEEDYGIPRLQDFLQRNTKNLNPSRVIDLMFDELEEWSPGADASDDRTLLVARAI